MDDTPPNLSDVNSVAYNEDIRTQLKTLHDMLGAELTDVANGAMEFGNKFINDGETILKYMSKFASQLSIMLINIRKEQSTLTPEEQQDYENIKSLTAVVGNLQDKLNRLIKTMRSAYELNQQIGEQGVSLTEDIINAQNEFRNVRANMNAYGFLSNNPELAHIFNEQQSSKQNTATQPNQV